jgi:hypothetical protein
VAYSLCLLAPAYLTPLFAAFSLLVAVGVVLRLRWAWTHLR